MLMAVDGFYQNLVSATF